MAKIKDLPARSWPLLIEKWVEHIPIEADLSNSEVTVHKLLEQNGTKLTDKFVIETVPALRQTVLSSAIFLHRKSQYCIDASNLLNHQGYPTWASLSMYDACFYSAKSICYLLGFVDSSRDNSFYLDIFYDEKRGKNLVDVGHMSFRLNERMTHAMLWEIFPRMIATLKIEDDKKPFIDKFRKANFKTFSRERNRLFYTCMGWSRQEEIQNSDLIERTQYQSNLDYFHAPGEIDSEYHHDYNDGGIMLHKFAASLIGDIGNRVPLVSTWLRNAGDVPIE